MRPGCPFVRFTRGDGGIVAYISNVGVRIVESNKTVGISNCLQESVGNIYKDCRAAFGV